MNGFRKQVVSVPDNWLHNNAEDWTRDFVKFAYLPVNAPDLPECTNDEKEQWEQEHPKPVPPEPEQPQEEQL